MLFVNHNRVFPLTRAALSDSAFEASQLGEWLRPAASVEAILDLLRSERVTHVLVERVDWGIAWPPALFALLDDPARARPLFETDDRRFVVYSLAAP